MANTPLRIVQISDIHLFADDKSELLGVKTQHSLQAVIDLLRSENKPIDLIILSGDLAQDGSEVAYMRVADMLKPFNVPVYCIPGNHDNVKTMAQIYPLESISNHRHIVLKNWHIILLNSQKPGAVEGFLDEAQLNYMQHCLRTYPEHHAIVLFHHQPVLIGSAWLDKLGLNNAAQFWELVSGFPKIKSVLFGHIHQEFTQDKNGIMLYSAPSTCIQSGHANIEKELIPLHPVPMSINQIWGFAFSFSSLGIIELGLLLLVATQTIRVALLCWFYSAIKDYKFTIISFFILAMLIYSSFWRS